MKLRLQLFIGAAIASTFSASAWAQAEPVTKLAPVDITGSAPTVGPEKTSRPFIRIEVKNFRTNPSAASPISAST